MAASRAVLDRLAEWASGKDTRIAEAGCPIDYQQRQVFAEARVLQSVVQHQDIGACPDGFLGRGGAIGADPGWGNLREEQTFVAHQGGGITGAHAVGPVG